MLPRDKTPTASSTRHCPKPPTISRVSSAKAGKTPTATTRQIKPPQTPNKDNGARRPRPGKQKASSAAAAATTPTPKNRGKMKV